MVDVWGGSWGASWNGFWAQSVAPPGPELPPAAPTVTRVGGGGSSPTYRPGTSGRPDFEERERIADGLRSLYAAVYAAVDGREDVPAEQIADSAAAVVAEYTPTSAPDLPPPSTVDWQAIAEDGRQAIMRVTVALKRLEAKAREIAADNDDDEEAAALLLL